MAEITQELDTIQNDIYGRNVKQAIHDALEKVNLDIESIVPSGTVNFPLGVPIDAAYGTAYSIQGIMREDPVIVQEISDSTRTSVSLSATVTEPCLLLVCVMHRDAVTISGEWTKVIESEPAYLFGSDTRQWITIWSKQIETAGTYTATVTQASSKLITMKLIGLHDVDMTDPFTVVYNDAIQDPLPFTPPAKNGKRRLYMLSSIIGVVDETVMAVTCTPGDARLSSYEERIFSVFYDRYKDDTGLPTFNQNERVHYQSYGINCLVLDITDEEE